MLVLVQKSQLPYRKQFESYYNDFYKGNETQLLRSAKIGVTRPVVVILKKGKSMLERKEKGLQQYNHYYIGAIQLTFERKPQFHV